MLYSALSDGLYLFLVFWRLAPSTAWPGSCWAPFEVTGQYNGQPTHTPAHIIQQFHTTAQLLAESATFSFHTVVSCRWCFYTSDAVFLELSSIHYSTSYARNIRQAISYWWQYSIKILCQWYTRMSVVIGMSVLSGKWNRYIVHLVRSLPTTCSREHLGWMSGTVNAHTICTIHYCRLWLSSEHSRTSVYIEVSSA